MLALCSRGISNDAKWPRELMCPGVKAGRPAQPLTPGSFIRLRSKHVPIDEGRCKGRRFSLFTSVQLTHQQLNHCSEFIKTVIVSIDSQAVQQKSPLVPTHHTLFLPFFSCCNINIKVCNLTASSWLGNACFPSDWRDLRTIVFTNSCRKQASASW